MADRDSLIEQAPIQDRDLLQRMSLYFDTVEYRLRQGEGWLIFNAGVSLAPTVATDARARAEFDLAARVTSHTWTRMLSTDLLVVDGCRPSHRHEAELLDRTLEARQAHKLATILMTPDMPQELEAEFETVDPEGRYWSSIFGRMYGTGLVAM